VKYTHLLAGSLAAALLITGCARDDNPQTTAAQEVDAALQRAGLDAQGEAAAGAATDRYAGNRVENDDASRDDGSPSADARAARALGMGLPDFTSLVDKHGDAVVNVEVVGRAENGGDDSLREFFRRFGMPQQPDQGEQLVQGMGSGFIVSNDGYILTNAHVVGEADEITVRLTDRREFTAKLVGTDARTDVAVIKIDAKDLPVVTIGKPSDLKTGEWVLAIGSPFGLDNTATAGIVSATARSVGGGSPVPFIQTDVAVNPGNSGGPLFNLDGEVVGINSMIFSQSGGYMGISFAVPIDEAIQVRDQLIKTGHVVRGRIGVGVQDVDAALASSFDLDRPRGALVSFVQPGSPAEKAGVKPGDVVLGVNGQNIDRSAELSNAIADLKPGEEAKLKVWRGARETQLTARVEQLEEPAQRAAKNAAPERNTPEDTKLGLVVRSLTTEEKKAVDTEGAVVVENVQGSAARAGLQPGDIILAVNNQQVRSVQDLRSKAEKLAKGEPAALLVERQGNQIFVPIRAG
jgi:serine protease Do